MQFRPALFCDDIDKKGFFFLFKKNELLYFGSGNDIKIPQISSPSELGLKTTEKIFIGFLDGVNVYTSEVLENEEPINNCCGVAEYTYASPRKLYPFIGDFMFSLAGRALHINNWTNGWKFCPACGTEMEPSKTERAKICPSCGRIDYPLFSPAVIVAVTKGDRLLLAHNNRYANKNRCSILAGFVESGESAEDTVRREIMEEVGIKVKNIKYFGSQNWPYPHSFMMGFTAEYESGEISPDGVEIGSAGWFKADELPEIPPFGSISRTLIEDFVKKYGNKNEKR